MIPVARRLKAKTDTVQFSLGLDYKLEFSCIGWACSTVCPPTNVTMPAKALHVDTVKSVDS